MEGSKHATVVILSSSSIRDRFNILVIKRDPTMCSALIVRHRPLPGSTLEFIKYLTASATLLEVCPDRAS